jgi:isoquinoline 1-oxidoreductase beta subunit
MKTDLTRRDFLKMTGTGLAIAVVSTATGYRLLSAAEMEKEDPAFRPSAWLRILPDNTVVVVVNKSEMGQGVYTSLPMIVADELEADWKNVRMEAAPAGDAYKDPVWGSQSTGGSSSISHMYEPLRKAGAAAREMLVFVAAREWKVPIKDCAANLGKVRHMKSRRTISYGKLVKKAAKLDAPQNPALKKESQFRYIGKEMPRLDMEDKVNGRTKFGIDSFVPGMLYAAIARPPAYGATPASSRKDEVMAMPGVRAVVPIPAGMAVLADTIDGAWKGRDALKPVWQNEKYPDLDTGSLQKEFLSRLDTAASWRETTATPGSPGRGRQRVEAVRAALSPRDHGAMNCTVDVRKDGCDIWVPTQNQTGVLGMAAGHGLKPGRCGSIPPTSAAGS